MTTTSKDFRFNGALVVSVTEDARDLCKEDYGAGRGRAFFDLEVKRQYREARSKMDQKFNAWLEDLWSGNLRPSAPDPPTESQRKELAERGGESDT